MRIRISLAGLLGLALLVGVGTASAQGREEARLLTSMQVVQELRNTPDQFVPERLLERAYGLAIFPDMTKAAFFLGGERGNGVLVVRDASGRFSNPIFINITGGSFGFQFGVQSTDLVLVFTTRSSIEKITGGKLRLGADASVAAGPVGRDATAGTDPTFHSEVYSYSRSRGLFAGIALDGSALTIDNLANSHFYDRGTVTPADIVSGAVTTNSEIAHRFMAAVNRATGASVSASAAPPPRTAPSTSAPAAAPPPEGTRTFPMQDNSPGQEPH